MPEENPASQILNLLPLGAEGRAVCWKIRGTSEIVRHRFGPVTFEAAKKYWRDLTPSRDRVGRPLNAKRPLNADLTCWESLVLAVEGYSLADGSDLTSQQDWRAAVPELEQRIAFSLLTKVESSEARTRFEPGHDVIFLDALWNERGPGEMAWYLRLAHKFRRRTSEDKAWLQDELSRDLVGGDGSSRPVVRQIVLAHFYDRMIAAVEGYGMHGQPLTSRDEIVSLMDAFHKVAAVERWLSGEMLQAQLPEKPGAKDDEDEE